MQQVKLISADDCLKFALSGEIDPPQARTFMRRFAPLTSTIKRMFYSTAPP